MACGKKILVNQQAEPARYFVVTETGMKKEGAVVKDTATRPAVNLAR